MFNKLFGGNKSGEPTQSYTRAEPAFGPSAPTPRPDTGKRANEVAEIIKKFVMSGCQDERGVHIESALSAMASLAGYSAQSAGIRLIQEKRPEAAEFSQVHEVKSKSGEVFLLSEMVNQLVAAAGGPDRLTVLTLIANGGCVRVDNVCPTWLAS